MDEDENKMMILMEMGLPGGGRASN